MSVVYGRFVRAQISWDGAYVVGADHGQVAQLLAYVARRFGVRLRWYGSTSGGSLAAAMYDHAAVAIDEQAADDLVLYGGEVALLFPVLHEVGHLKHWNLRGRAGERAADSFATYACLALGYAPAQILRGAAFTLARTPGDAVHDPGWQRLDLIAHVIASHVPLS